MPTLSLPADFPFPGMATKVAIGDAMFQGSAEHYLSVGLSALKIIDSALERQSQPLRLLDLPCEHGRITRILRARFPDAEITVSDIDYDGVAFCESHFGARGVPSSGDFQSLSLGGPFDLIWVGSRMTRLSEQMIRQMMDCLVRHIAPDATLIISSHGRYVTEYMPHLDYGLGRDRTQTVLEDYHRYGFSYCNYPRTPNYGVSVIRLVRPDAR